MHAYFKAKFVYSSLAFVLIFIANSQQPKSLARYTLPSFSKEVDSYLTAKDDTAPSSKMLNLIVNQIWSHLIQYHVDKSHP